jgi:uncharacterized damage-inducible protein DinB
MSRLALAVEQITIARKYTAELLDAIDPADWFRQPTEGVTHVAWQVGHLAFAEYRLLLDRVRGPRPEDEQLIPEAFLAHFGRDSVPNPDPARNPAPGEIRAVFERVHDQALRELQNLPEAELDATALKPHRLFTTKAGALFWCARHEMLHAGQIGLLRRLLGRAPLW